MEHSVKRGATKLPKRKEIYVLNYTTLRSCVFPFLAFKIKIIVL